MQRCPIAMSLAVRGELKPTLQAEHFIERDFVLLQARPRRPMNAQRGERDPQAFYKGPK